MERIQSLSTYSQADVKSGEVFFSVQNIAGALLQNSVTAFT